MIIDLNDLREMDFSLSDIEVILQKPTYRCIDNKARRFNGFIYVVAGELYYHFEGGEISLSPGSLLYLPFASHHTMTCPTAELEFYRINFTLRVDGNIALFSKVPLKITDRAPTDCADTIRSLAGDYNCLNNILLKKEKLCRILASLQRDQTSARALKLAPAVNYIHEHLIEGFSCQELAALCFLSTAQFYNLFRIEYSSTPLEYRDQLLLRQATVYLGSNMIPVSETAQLLGFESAAYFSRFFKKHTGLSPSEYAKRHVEM